MTHIVQLPVNNLPLLLTLFEDRSVAIQRLANFEPIVDTPEEGSVYAVFDSNGFSLFPNKLFTEGVEV